MNLFKINNSFSSFIEIPYVLFHFWLSFKCNVSMLMYDVTILQIYRCTTDDYISVQYNNTEKEIFCISKNEKIS